MRTATPYPAVFQTYEARRSHHLKWAKREFVEAFSLPKGKLLDVGCAEGFWTDIFHELGYEAHGCDVEPQYIANGRKKYPNVFLTEADLFGDLPYDNGEFDVVFARGLSPFTQEDLEPIRDGLDIMLSLTAHGGVTLVSFYSNGEGLTPGVYNGFHYHHPHETYLELAREVGFVSHHKSVGNYLQIGLAR